MTDISPVAEDLAARLTAKGVTLKVRNNRLWIRPGSAYKELSDEDRAILRHHRTDLKTIAARGVPDVPKARPRPMRRRAEPEPEFYAYNHRITGDDVVETLRALGDQALADYRAGRIAKAKAYAMARHCVRQTIEIEAATRRRWT